ncbi:MAG: T9SS type A sorting domain-containing protein [Bacteroidetes bacterium]|nr:T9SS type A sorting domain-containing protein [Bacteroidota bacterium]
MIRIYTLFVLILIQIPFSGHTQNGFIVHDELAADQDASIIDPEYNMDLKIVCWQSVCGELWVCSLNPVTRCFVPSDGKGTLIDVDLTPPTPGGWNGPEWMLSTGCTQIVYNQKKGDTRFPAVATQVLGGWNSTTLMDYPGALYAMATRNYSDSVGMFLFESESNDGIRWVNNTDFNKCNLYPDVTLGFFANDNQQICCAYSHSRQPGFVEVQTMFPYFTQISDDTIGAPSMWNDPETNSRMFMYRTNGSKTLKIFQENADGNWYLFNSFSSPVPYPYQYITSPEPFQFGGRSYVSFMAAQSTMGMDEMPAQIWIAAINPDHPLMRRVSDSAEAIRIDPEPVIFSDSAFIYYTEKVFTMSWQHIHMVKKCETGLENYLTSTPESASAVPIVSIFPNPSGGSITVNSALLKLPHMSQVEIYNDDGKLMIKDFANANPAHLDLDLPSGHYTLRLRNQLRSATTSLIIR